MSNDYGPAWRYQHGNIIPREDGIDPRGDRVVHSREAFDCPLDKLFATGRLGGGDKAGRRYNAGIWLRSLFLTAGIAPRVGMAYNVLGSRNGGGDSEAQDWNRKCYNDTLRDLRKWSMVLQSVCCYDNYPRSAGMSELLIEGLDALADLRGM